MISFSRDEEAARDGVSQAFAQALARRSMLEAMPDAAMKAWLYATARNAVVDIKRRERRMVYMDFPSFFGELADPREADPAGKTAMRALLDLLPPALREPVERKYFEGMNASEIGAAMKLPAATVRTRLRTALIRLRGQL
jgi:RNA polymerase sigma-70 factor (ECF subfamily)